MPTGQYHLFLMRRSAVEFLEAAKRLDEFTHGQFSNQTYLLRLTGFELLLKLVYELSNDAQAPETHRYNEIFERIPSNVREQMRTYVQTELTSNGHESSVCGVLHDLMENFTTMRYLYDQYRDTTKERYTRLGEQWIEKGAPELSARVQFHPAALEAFIGMMLNMTEPVQQEQYEFSDDSTWATHRNGE
ncbi:MAG: hypothetical protein ABI190_03065 [Casimicrobiaceae bacterium]